jgi:hypothetical protein
MGLKGFRLWAMDQLDSNVQSPAVTDLNEALWPCTALELAAAAYGCHSTPGCQRLDRCFDSQNNVSEECQPWLLVPGLFNVLFGVRTQRFYPQMTS